MTVGISLSGIGAELEKAAREEIEKKIVAVVVEHYWPAVEETLRQEFPGAGLETALKAGRRACERLLEHVV